MRSLIRSIFVLSVCLSFSNADDVEIQIQSGNMLKMLRDMANQTDANPLNLPANASSIRQNITDTFSCENKTYGYYADVDNDCQIFHVCLPSQTPSGRNVTYKWSFICPNETIFNQEVLVCTRPMDSIPCEESPNYYDLNMEIGKVPNNTRKDNDVTTNKNDVKQKKTQRRKPDNRKQALIEKLMDELVYENIDQQIDNEAVDENVDVFPIIDVEGDMDKVGNGGVDKFVNSGEMDKFVNGAGDKFVSNSEMDKVVIGESMDKFVKGESMDKFVNSEDKYESFEPNLKVNMENLDERLALERSMGRKKFRFTADV